RDLALDPHRREPLFDHRPQLLGDLGDRQHGAAAGHAFARGPCPRTPWGEASAAGAGPPPSNWRCAPARSYRRTIAPARARARPRVRVWHIVTVAWRARRSWARRFPTRRERPTTTASFPSGLAP